MHQCRTAVQFFISSQESALAYTNAIRNEVVAWNTGWYPVLPQCHISLPVGDGSAIHHHQRNPWRASETEIQSGGGLLLVGDVDRVQLLAVL